MRLSVELERDSRREKRKGKKWVSIEEGKEREKIIGKIEKGREISKAGNDLNKAPIGFSLTLFQRSTSSPF
jgi:hypothetical protein